MWNLLGSTWKSSSDSGEHWKGVPPFVSLQCFLNSPQLSTSPPHNNSHRIISNTTRTRNDAKDREQGYRGAAPTTIGNVTNHMARTNNHMEVEVEEEESHRTPTTTINSKEVAEEAPPPTSGTTAEEQGSAETTSGTKTVADNVVRQGNHIPTQVK